MICSRAPLRSGELFVQQLDALGEFAQASRVTAARVSSSARTRKAAQVVDQLGGLESAQLERSSSGAVATIVRSWLAAWVRDLVGAALHDLQQAQRLDRPVVRLRGGRRLTGQHRPSGGDRVDNIGLPVAAADLPVRPGHLDHLARRRRPGAGPGRTRSCRCPRLRPRAPARTSPASATAAGSRLPWSGSCSVASTPPR